MGEYGSGPALEDINVDEAKKTFTSEEFLAHQTQNNPNFNPKEFEFHQARFARKAEAYEEKNAGKSHPKMSAVDFAHEEALRDNAEYELRRSVEYKEWEQKLKIVIENLIKKRDDPEGEGKNIRPLLLIMGGGVKGVYGAGQVIALGRMGFREVFDNIVGISSGASDAAYFLSAKEGDDTQTLSGTTIYNENLATNNFFNPKKLLHVFFPNALKRGKEKYDPPMDVGYAVDIIKNDPVKALDTEEIMRKKPGFWVQTTDPNTLESRLINAKGTKEGIVNALHASMAVPFVYRKEITVTDEEHGETLNIDGAFKPFPIKEVVAKFNPTDVLILPQMRFEKTDIPYLMKLKEHFWLGVMKSIPKLGSSAAIQKWFMIDAENKKTLEELKAMHVNVAVAFAPDAGLGPVTGDPDEVKLGAWQAATDLFKKFGHPEMAKDLTLK